MPLHITVAAIVKKNDRFLFVEEMINNKVFINQPAGHLELHETLTEAVVRECLEETGWDVRPEFLSGIYQLQITDKAATYIRFCFYCEAIKEHTDAKLDKEIIRTHWLSANDFHNTDLEHRSPLVKQSLNDYIDGSHYPLSILQNYVY